MSEGIAFENYLQPHRRIVLEQQFGEASNFSYLIGNTKPSYIDMESCQVSPACCLFLGSGDLRNALYMMMTSRSIDHWEIHLVDINPCVTARNLLLLEAFNDETASIDRLWAIWYDFLLDESTGLYLQELIRRTIEGCLETVREEDRTLFVGILHAWQGLFSSVPDESKASKQRHEHMSFCFEHLCKTTFDRHMKRTCDSVSKALAGEDTTTVERACNEVRQYMTEGTSGPKKNQRRVNVTMLQAASGFYTGHYDMQPFQGYLPFDTVDEQKEFRRIVGQHAYPLVAYGKHRLDQWTSAYRQNREKVRWQLWCGDALNLALFHMPLLEFDLVHTSNLCDHLGLLNLLVTCVHLLRHRSWSRIVTQSLKWRSVHARFTDHISQVFNITEITWIPSLLGVMYESPRAIRPPSPQETASILGQANNMDSRQCQTWRLTMHHQYEPHLRVDGPDSHVLGVLDRIAERCSYVHTTKIAGHEGTGHSTALTYYLLLRQYSQRCCIRPEAAFEYLFQRTCDRFRAYATNLRALHALFSNEEMYVCTPTLMDFAKTFNLLPKHIDLPALQLVLIRGGQLPLLLKVTGSRVFLNNRLLLFEILIFV